MGRSAISDKPFTTIDRRLLTPHRDLRQLELLSAERTDHRTLHLAFLRRCESIAQLLAASDRGERLTIYSAGYVDHHELSTAAALRPDLMPIVNGEWEWIALTMADLD